jgi:hypothetical protein
VQCCVVGIGADSVAVVREYGGVSGGAPLRLYTCTDTYP